MSEPWILKAAIIKKENIDTFGFEFNVFDFEADIITPKYTLKNFRILNNFAWGLNEHGDSMMIIDLSKNKKLQIVPKSTRVCLN